MWLGNIVADLQMQIIDIIISLIGLIILSPLFVLLAIGIKLDSTGSIFYRAKRVGKDKTIFYLYKFRSMSANAAKQGPGITTANDKRVTRIGQFLRHSKLDELPQLINVLKGEMSLVGPRPEDPRYVALYTLAQHQILQVRPGITSAASLAYRHEEQILSGDNWEVQYLEDVMPAKINIDLAYLSERTIISDFILIGRTVLSIFT